MLIYRSYGIYLLDSQGIKRKFVALRQNYVKQCSCKSEVQGLLVLMCDFTFFTSQARFILCIWSFYHEKKQQINWISNALKYHNNQMMCKKGIYTEIRFNVKEHNSLVNIRA